MKPISSSKKVSLYSTDHSNFQMYHTVAIQSWALCRSMIGDFVPEANQHLERYLLMIEITDYLMAPHLLEEELGYLKVLIEQHHSTFSRIYPGSSFIPKMHYLVHMPRLIYQLVFMYHNYIYNYSYSLQSRFEPLVRQWTMRFEAKHSYFKNVAQSIGNFKNLSLTLGKRQQLMSSYHCLDVNSISQENPDIGPGIAVYTIKWSYTFSLPLIGKCVAVFDRPPELQHECVECFRYDLFNVECHTCKSHSCLYTLACMFCSWLYMYYTYSEFLIKE